MQSKMPIINGYASFPTIRMGLQSLAALANDYYVHHNLKTLPQFIGRYAPASENDVQQYMRTMCKLLGINPLTTDTYDLKLNQAWAAFEFIKAITIVECGRSSPQSNCFPYYFSASDLVLAIAATGEWIGL